MLHILPLALGEELSRLQIMPSSYSRLYYLLVSSALCSPWFSSEKAHILTVIYYAQYSVLYSVTCALRHFVIHSVWCRYPTTKLCLQLSSAPRVRRELYMTDKLKVSARGVLRGAGELYGEGRGFIEGARAGMGLGHCARYGWGANS